MIRCSISYALLLVAFNSIAVAQEDRTEPRTIFGLELSEAGFVSVLDFGADSTGRRVCTKQIQEALNHARDHQLACLFPEGTYLVDDTLDCRQTEDTYAHVIVGHSTGRMPVVKLADNSPGFGKDEEMKSVFHFYRHRPGLDKKNDAPSHYNQVIREIGIDLGRGNPMAVGINHEAAQGSTIQNVTIAARDGFAGIRGLMGSGAAVAGVTIHGGGYGIYDDQSRPAPVVTGFRFFGQKKAAIFVGNTMAPTMVGFQCQLRSGVLIETSGWGNKAVSLIDGVVELAGPLVKSDKDLSLYANNVYVKGLTPGIQIPGRSFSHAKDDWVHVDEIAMSDTEVNKLINGQRSTGPFYGSISKSNPPQASVISKHWPSSSVPKLHAENVVNVRAFGAVGDGKTDDSAAIQKAIDSSRDVFVPKGVYLLSRTIQLKKDTRLFGVARHLCIFTDDPNWDEDSLTPMMRTVDDADATTRLAFLGFMVRGGKSGTITALTWMAGRNSVVQDVDFDRDKPFLSKQGNVVPATGPHALVSITGNGGGRWYHHWLKPRLSSHPDARYLLVESTQQPLSFYSLCVEYAAEDTTMVEIRDARDVQVFGFKTETYFKHGTERSRFATPLRIRDSKGISIFSHDGKSEATKGEGIIEVIDSKDVRISHVRRWGKDYLSAPDDWFLVREVNHGKTVGSTAEHFLNLYRSGK